MLRDTYFFFVSHIILFFLFQISIDSDDGIMEVHCSCPRGQAVCHHMAALCIYAHHNISITDKACSWNRQKPSVTDSVTRISDLYPSKQPDYVAVQRTSTTAEVEQFRKDLGHANTVGFTWYLRPEPSPAINIIPSIESIIFSIEYTTSLDKENYFVEKCKVTQSVIAQVHEMTVGQADNENWLIARKYRLTSSKFGAVIAACKRNKYPKSLFTHLVEGYDLSGVQAVQWGKENEKCAVNKFEEILGLKVEPAGFCLERDGFLGASPDGYVSEKCIIEAKCPFKLRNEKNLKEALSTETGYIVYYKDQTLVVNENHSYYHQIQGQLHITNRDMCYLIIWIPNDCIVARISRDEDWKCNLDLLKTFYVKHFLNFLTS